MHPSADHVVETLGTAADENRIEPLRQDQVINLPAEGELWMTGDLHDHRRNFEKLVRAANLEENPQRHLVLHELIHGDHYDAAGAEESWITLYRAAELKCDFPEQVHFMLANHDLAQIHGKGIMKAGLSVCEAFTKGVKKAFEGQHNVVTVAISEFLLSLPLAIRAPNGIFCCHSLPTDDQIDEFDFSIFDRPLAGPDYAQRTGPVYQLIWGRNMSPATVDKFAEKVRTNLILTGHQPQESGYAVNGDKQLILASDHNQGVFLPIDL
ncbi:MAG TPA: metallophosphoesterase, partial [Tepidisphaeraceae bacterium]